MSNDIKQPERGFGEQEFIFRLQRVQAMMHERQLDALLLTEEHELRYFTGFLSQFWLSPTRPWFLVVPLQGKPIAVIPSIGEVGMQATWIDDIRCWSAPRPEDDGISLLISTLGELPRRFGQLGIPLGIETRLRMPVLDFKWLIDEVSFFEPVDCGELLHRLMAIKSIAEIKKIHRACRIAGSSFAALPQFASTGDSERQVVNRMRIDMLNRGADDVPFIVSASGPDGYDNIIMGPSDRVLSEGDLLIIDTGARYDGYYCDFDRNFAFGKASDKTRYAYDSVYKATEAGLAIAAPGVTTSDLWRAMWAVLEASGAEANSVGRMGHGLGMCLTEWPSNTATDDTVLEAGMVLTLEPGMGYDNGKQMVHEENIVITTEGAELLTERASPELPVVAA